MLKIITSVSTNLFAVYLIRRFMAAFFSSGAEDKKKEWMVNGLFLVLTEIIFLFFQFSFTLTTPFLFPIRIHFL